MTLDDACQQLEEQFRLGDGLDEVIDDATRDIVDRSEMEAAEALTLLVVEITGAIQAEAFKWTNVDGERRRILGVKHIHRAAKRVILCDPIVVEEVEEGTCCELTRDEAATAILAEAISHLQHELKFCLGCGAPLTAEAIEALMSKRQALAVIEAQPPKRLRWVKWKWAQFSAWIWDKPNE